MVTTFSILITIIISSIVIWSGFFFHNKRYAIAFTPIIAACFGALFLFVHQEYYANYEVVKNKKIRILATTAMVADMVKSIGGEHVIVDTLIASGLDPHSYVTVHGDAQLFTDANLVFFSGLDLEHAHSIKKQIKLHPKSFGIGNYILHHHPEDILQSDGFFDPHIWLDLSLWSQGIEFVVTTLSDEDPDHASYYMQRAMSLRERYAKLHLQLKEELQEVRDNNMKFVSAHYAFAYFVRAYIQRDKEKSLDDYYITPEGLAPDKEISIHDIKKVVQFVIDHQISILFSEYGISRKALEKVATILHSLGRSVAISEFSLLSDTLLPGMQSVEEMVKHNVGVIQKEFGHGEMGNRDKGIYSNV